jgi:hypothetical protein
MMSDYRLLIDADALDFIAGLKRSDQKRLFERMRLIQSFPSNYCDYEERDPTGRKVQVNVHAGYAIEYWEDFADRHLKVLVIRYSDR